MSRRPPCGLRPGESVSPHSTKEEDRRRCRHGLRSAAYLPDAPLDEVMPGECLGDCHGEQPLFYLQDR